MAWRRGRVGFEALELEYGLHRAMPLQKSSSIRGRL
jgi:hypothetical protein